MLVLDDSFFTFDRSENRDDNNLSTINAGHIAKLFGCCSSHRPKSLAIIGSEADLMIAWGTKPFDRKTAFKIMFNGEADDQISKEDFFFGAKEDDDDMMQMDLGAIHSKPKKDNNNNNNNNYTEIINLDDETSNMDFKFPSTTTTTTTILIEDSQKQSNSIGSEANSPLFVTNSEDEDEELDIWQ